MTISGGAGSDTISGGDKDDSIAARDDTADTITCGLGTDSIVIDRIDVRSGCETEDVPPPPTETTTTTTTTTTSPTETTTTPTTTSPPGQQPPPTQTQTGTSTTPSPAAPAKPSLLGSPKLVLKANTLSTGRTGSCLGAGPDCTFTVTVKLGSATVASKAIKVKAGQQVALKLTLSGKAKKKLKGKLKKAKVSISARR
jgi:hypothetical protein